MSADEIMALLPTVFRYLLIASIVLLILFYVRNEIRLHRNSQAPVCSERATVHYKHTEKEMVYAGRGNNELFYITFHTEFGQQVKLYMTYEYFYTLEEGDTGILTWQGERFWKFVPDKKKEVQGNV